MPQFPSPKIHLSLIAIALLAAELPLILLARSGGYSALRLLLVAFTFLLAALAAGAALMFQLNPGKASALHEALARSSFTKWSRLALSLVFLILWCLTWLPPQYTRDAYYYFIGFYPLILCGLLASGLALIYITAAGRGSSTSKLAAHWREHGALLAAALISLASFLAVTLLTRFWHILQNNEPYWRGAGVPLLSLQVFIALVIGILSLKLEVRLPGPLMRLDLLLFLIVWAIAAVLWARQPIGESYWVTGPTPPNQEYYPFLDLETFDLGSQFALIGQGIFNRQFWDRALYMSFLVYLHMVGGQDYQQLMSIQAALFAIFPALLYLLGSRLHSRSAGIILAALTTIRGLNSLTAAPVIHSSTFKHMLTDFPTAIGLAVFVLCLVKWLEAPRRHQGAALWAGGVLGLTSLLRPHVLVLLPALLGLDLLIERSRPTRGLLLAALTLAAFVAAIAPWTFTGSGATSLATFYGRRIQDVMRQRYPPLFPTPSASVQPAATPAIAAPTESSGADQSPQVEVLPAAAPTPLPPGARPLPPPSDSGIPFQVLHYVHNLITSALVFPATPEFLSLRDTFRRGEDFWELRWDGRMSSVAAGMLIVNLLVLSVGLGTAFQGLRWRGLLPLVVFLLYHAANAFARTSGGRYLVPVDWILVCYYGLGLAALLRLGSGLGSAQAPVARAAPPATRVSDEHARSLRALPTLACLLLIGSLVPLAGVLHPLRYPPQPPSALIQSSRPYLESLGIHPEDIESLVGQPGAVVLNGRALYPRFNKRGGGVVFSPRLSDMLDYPRTTFDLIGPHGLAYVVLPGGPPEALPNTSDAIVIGCRFSGQDANVISALAVVLPQQAVALIRSPAASPSCPLPEPLCDDSGNCR